MVKDNDAHQTMDGETETWDMRESFNRYLESARDNHDETPIFIEVLILKYEFEI